MSATKYQDGQRNAVKACVAWLHARAEEMNDPHARAVLNSAALGMGVHFKRPVPGEQPEGVRK